MSLWESEGAAFPQWPENEEQPRPDMQIKQWGNQDWAGRGEGHVHRSEGQKEVLEGAAWQWLRLTGITEVIGHGKESRFLFVGLLFFFLSQECREAIRALICNSLWLMTEQFSCAQLVIQIYASAKCMFETFALFFVSLRLICKSSSYTLEMSLVGFVYFDYSSPFYRLPSHFLNGIFGWVDIFNFNDAQFTNFIFCE